MRVRPAVLSDCPVIAELAARSWPDTPFADKPMPTLAFFLSAAQGFVEQPQNGAFVLADDADVPVGVFAGGVFQHPFSGQRLASELMLWVAPEARGYGLQLLAVAEDWARGNGADELHCYAHTPDLERFYQLAKFRPLERTFVKDLR